jgi:hypothetical protein
MSTIWWSLRQHAGDNSAPDCSIQSASRRALGIRRLVLDTAIDNLRGQRFYFRYGMLPAGLRFAMPLD